MLLSPIRNTGFLLCIYLMINSVKCVQVKLRTTLLSAAEPFQILSLPTDLNLQYLMMSENK